MTTDEMKARLREYVDAYNRAAYDELAADFVTADYVHHSNGDPLTFEGFRRGAEWLRVAMPDFAVETVELIADGEALAVRWLARGTHGASMFGEPVSGRPVTLYGTTVYHFADGRIADDWEVMDEADLRRQVSAPIA